MPEELIKKIDANPLMHLLHHVELMRFWKMADDMCAAANSGCVQTHASSVR
jgi:hypothetical protein